MSPRQPRRAAACKRAALAVPRNGRNGARGDLLSGPKWLWTPVPRPTGTGPAHFATSSPRRCRALGPRTGFELWGCFDDVRTSRRTRVYGSSVDHYWAFQCKPRIRHWGPVMGGHNAPLGSAERLAAAPNESVGKRSSARRVVRRCTTTAPAHFYREAFPMLRRTPGRRGLRLGAGLCA